MRALRQASVVIPILATLSVSLSAQWPSYPTRNVPRTADGKPNLLAPAPRTADQRPDLSGIWGSPGWRELGAQTGSSGTGGSPGTPAVLPRGPGLFFDIGSGVPGGLPFQPWAADLRKKRMAEGSKDNPDAHCLPMGNMPDAPQPRKRRPLMSSDPLRGKCIRRSHRRPVAAAQRSATGGRLLGRPAGRRDFVVRSSGFRTADG
jgi:hypothetical protein